MPAYLSRTYRLPAALEDAASALLWPAGCLGVETREGGAGRLLLLAFFDAEAPFSPERIEALEGVELIATEPVPEADWLAPWRERAEPVAVGRRLLLDPREPEEGHGPERATGGRFVLRLPARRAFGTGSHESTRLVLEVLEEMPLHGLRVLDVGTGTGVLAFAALLFGARSVVATEADAEALLVASTNRRLNGLAPSFTAARLAALAPGAGFDLALVNILPENILPELGALAGLVRGGGEALFSGIVEECRADVLGALARSGFSLVSERHDGEWVCLRCRREAA